MCLEILIEEKSCPNVVSIELYLRNIFTRFHLAPIPYILEYFKLNVSAALGIDTTGCH